MKSSIIEILSEHGLKSTPIRREMIAALQRSSQPLSADALLTILRKAKRRKVDEVTVYRNLKNFVDAGIFISINLGTGRSLYEFNSAERSKHHHHVICQTCEKIEHLDVCGLEPHLKLLEGMGYRNLLHNLEFSGICASCHQG